MREYALTALRLLDDWRPRRHFPHAHLPPTDSRANWSYRKSILRVCSKSASARRAMLKMAKADCLFWMRTFVWTDSQLMHPRAPTQPFNPSPYQELVAWRILDAIGFRNLWACKARDTVFSVTSMVTVYWKWWASPPGSQVRMQMNSWKEELVDNRPESDTLFAKFDFITAFWMKVAPWLLPKGFDPVKHRTERSLLNPENDCHISGEATSSDAGRSKKKACIFFDEFDKMDPGKQRSINRALSGASNCVIKGSTFSGEWAISPFKEECERGLRTGHTLPIPFFVHKRYGYGARVLRADMPLVHGLTLRKGEITSPWLEWKARETNDAALMSNEFLMRPEAAGVIRAVDPYELSRVKRRRVAFPIHEGKLVFEGGRDADDENRATPVLNVKFVREEGGPLKLWCELDDENRPIGIREPVLGCDVAAGTTSDDDRGYSNSVGSGGDAARGEKILEYAVSGTEAQPHRFAPMMVALAKWMGDATMIWENRVSGSAFRNCVVKNLKYPYFYRFRDDTRPDAPTTGKPGWEPSRRGKNVLLADYFGALLTGTYVTHSNWEYFEAAEYQKDGADYWFGKLKGLDDPTGARENHGDRVGSAALLWKQMNAMCPRVSVEKRVEIAEQRAEPGSMAWLTDRYAERGGVSLVGDYRR